MIKLGVNIDHVATVRQARLGASPSVCLAAVEAVKGGADSITMHLREDRRHIQDRDLLEVKKRIRVPLNMEMSLDPSIVKIALKLKPEKVCLVPEKRKELTTEGGLDVVRYAVRLKKIIPALQKKKIEVSLFIDPSVRQIQAAAALKADAVELHTGKYCDLKGLQRKKELARLKRAARLGSELGLIVNAGHGLDLENTKAVAAIPEINELNIGHSIVGRALFVGMKEAVREMKNLIRRHSRRS